MFQIWTILGTTLKYERDPYVHGSVLFISQILAVAHTVPNLKADEDGLSDSKCSKEDKAQRFWVTVLLVYTR